MNRDIYISDQFNTLRRCNRLYWLKYIRGLNVTDLAQDYFLGKSVHALVNYHLKGYDVGFLLQNADAEVTSRWNLLKDKWLKDKTAIKSESSFMCRLSSTSFWLKGRMDAVFFDEKKNLYTIADWKTGENIPSNPYENFQHIVYLYSFFKLMQQQNRQIRHEDLIFKYIKISDVIEEHDFHYSKELEVSYEKLMLKNVKTIKLLENGELSAGVKECTIKKMQV